jgi:hypothetical protein
VDQRSRSETLLGDDTEVLKLSGSGARSLSSSLDAMLKTLEGGWRKDGMHKSSLHILARTVLAGAVSNERLRNHFSSMSRPEIGRIERTLFTSERL